MTELFGGLLRMVVGLLAFSLTDKSGKQFNPQTFLTSLFSALITGGIFQFGVQLDFGENGMLGALGVGAFTSEIIKRVLDILPLQKLIGGVVNPS